MGPCESSSLLACDTSGCCLTCEYIQERGSAYSSGRTSAKLTCARLNSGDVIGCFLDVSGGTIEFQVNGKGPGGYRGKFKAFKHVSSSHGLVPACSIQVLSSLCSILASWIASRFLPDVFHS